MAKPAPSEWGKLSAGQSYIPWAFDVARAVFSVGLGENVGSLFWYVVERSWGGAKVRRDGWADPVPVQISYAELAKLWGVKPQRIYDAKKWLVAARLLIENEKGLWVNKNADDWIKPETGEPLLSPDRLSYARSGRTRTHKRDQQTPTNVTTLEPNVQTLDEGGAISRSNVTPSNVATLEISRCTVRSHIEERTRGKNQRKKEENNTESVVSSPCGEPREDGCPEYPDGDGGMWCIHPGRFPMDERQARRIFRMLWTGFGKASLCYQFYQHQNFHTDEVWIAAIRQAKFQDTSVGHLSYIEKIAREYQENGVPTNRPLQAQRMAERSGPKTVPMPRLQSNPERYRRQRRTGSN